MLSSGDEVNLGGVPALSLLLFKDPARLEATRKTLLEPAPLAAAPTF